MCMVKTQPDVFSSKFAECVQACASMVSDQVIGRAAVTMSPVCARLNPRVSLTGCRFSIFRAITFMNITNHMTATKAAIKKNHQVR